MTVLRRARPALRGVLRSFPVADVALWAAGATFFGMIGIVPIALVSLWLAAVLAGSDTVTAGMAVAIGGLPPGHGTPSALRTLTLTALGMTWLQVLVALFPASLYGEGLRRAFLQLSPTRGERLTGWRGRLGLVPVIAVAPVMVLAVLATAPFIAPLYDEGGSGLLLGVVLAFHVIWVLVSISLVLVYRLVAAGTVGLRAVVVGGFTTGAILSGFLQGFLLFLAIPVEWSLPFGGLPVFGAVAALALWLYLIHVLILVGYRLTLGLDEPAPGSDSGS